VLEKFYFFLDESNKRKCLPLMALLQSLVNIKLQGCAIVLAHKTCLHDHITAI